MATFEKINTEDLIKAIKEASAGRNNINEIEANVSLVFDSAENRDGTTYVILKSVKNNKRYPIHLLSFCNLRLTDNADDIKAEWSGDLSSDSNVFSFQDAMLAGTVTGLSSDYEFKLVKRVKIQNLFKAGKAQLKPKFYKGFGDYSTNNAAAFTIEDPEKRKAQYQANRMELYKSDILDNASYDNADNNMCVPIFTIKKK